MSNKFDLIKLLKTYNVVIPIIQRDYAQGRKDKQFIRKTFLKDIKNCLENEKPMTLDFIYGNEELGRFYPLDGQQRLTTLWLVYWYVALKTDNLSQVKNNLSKFSYETRESSKEFCRALCNINSKSVSGNSIVDYIKQQTWFYSTWLQDPTISAMLRTLGEDQESERENIEDIFKGCDLTDYFNKLTNAYNPLITFELMVIGNSKLPVSDDLYIKMNARGKALTDFENFKADLVSWIIKKEEFTNISPEGNTSLKEYYPAQIDNKWTDVFWKYVQGKSGKVDDIFFSFINRYVLNLICIDENYSPSSFVDGKDERKKDFDKLYGVRKDGYSADDSLISYEGFDTYEHYLDPIVIGNLDKLFDIISNKDIQKSIRDALYIKDADEENENSQYSFFPQIDNNGKLIPTKQKERVYFLAITLFIVNLENDFDLEKFRRWMRVARNLIENAGIDSIPTMITCMRLINDLSVKLKEHSCDIYTALKNYEIDSSSSILDYQLKEEKEKAVKILENKDWEEAIIKAENYSFFNGSIRFLFHDGQGYLDWDQFDAKYKESMELFILEEKRVKCETVQRFLQYFKSFDEIYDLHLFTTVGYHPRNKCWKKNILCNNDLKDKVHLLLLEGPIPTHDVDYKDFLNSGLIERIVKKDFNYRYRLRNRYGIQCIYREYSQSEGVYVTAHRKEMCEKFNKYIESDDVHIEDSEYNCYCKGFYWGINVTFSDNNNTYVWSYEKMNDNAVDNIYLLKNGEYLKEPITWNGKEDLITLLKGFQEILNKNM